MKVERVLNCSVRSDALGDGEYGSNRGTRKHRGIDYAVLPGDKVLSPVSGTITKIGYCYGDDLSYRYIQVTNKRNGDTYDHRLFYVRPLGKYGLIGSTVHSGDPIGLAQDISERYSTDQLVMTPHVHYEIKKNGSYIDPDSYN